MESWAELIRTRSARWALALALGLPAAGAVAQETEIPVGPSELRDFVLPGTPPAEREEPAAETPPPAQTPAAETPPPAQTPAAESPPPRAAPRRPAERAAPRPEPAPQAAPAPRTGEPMPEPAPLAEPLPLPEPAMELPPIPAPPPAAIEQDSAEPQDSSWLYGLAAMLVGVLGLAALWKLWWSRRVPVRRSPSLSSQLGARGADAPALPRPGPETRARPVAEPAAIPTPAAAAAPADNAPRPRIEILFKPAKAEATEIGASVHYDLVVKNLGSLPARNVRIEARMFNAGAEQETEIGAFYAKPFQDKLVTRPFEIPARSQAKLSRTVRLDSSEVRAITIQGRRLFIPMVAFNIVYDWGEAESGQTSRCYVVGRESETPTEKMGAFRLDLGPRIYRSVGQRQTDMARIA